MSIEATLGDFSDAVSEENWQLVGALLADDFFEHRPGRGAPSASDHIVPLLSELRSAVPDLEVRVDDLTSDGSWFRGVFSMRGTHRGSLWGAPGSGESVAWTNPVTLRLIDGKLAFRFDDVVFPDLVALLRQFGLVNPPDRMDEPPPYPVSPPEFLMKVIMTGQAGDKECSHLGQIRVTEPETRMCAQCYAEGVNWPALRMCLTCGAVGCCDTSKNKHAMKHHENSGHPMVRSIRMDESWVWCYEDNAFFEGDVLDRHFGQ